MFAFAAAIALPLVSAPTAAQAPAAIDVESLDPISGSWIYRPIVGGSEADFLDSSATVRFKMRCNRSVRSVSIIRTAVPAAAPTLSIWTSTISRTVPARFLSTRELVADLAATDPLLDAIAFSRGRFGTAAAGAPMLVLPVWAALTRVIEDCRS